MEATNEGFSCEGKSNISDEILKKDNASVAREQETTKLKTCTFFFNNNYCKFGSNCRYEHVKREFKNERTPMQYNMRKGRQVTNKNESQNREKPTTLKQNCRYHKAGTCRNGDDCEFLHSDELINEISALNISSQSRNSTKKYFSNNGSSKAKTSMPLCYYFKRGLCHRGDSCKFYHQNKSSSYCDNMKDTNKSPLSDKSTMPVTKSSTREKTVPFTNKNMNTCDLTLLTSNDISQLRSTEISQLKKRFPRFGVISENQAFSIIFQPSDPDWAFDLNKLHLEVDFPINYPKEECKITVVQSAENIPFLFIKYLNKAIFDWIHEKFEQNNALNKTELIFRPFLKWFDKNLEDLFVTGLRKVKQDLKAKADGIEFVDVENLFSSSIQSKEETSIVDSPELQENHSTTINFSDLEVLDPSSSNPSELQKQNSAAVNKTSSGLNQNNKPFYFSSNNGTKIIFTNLEFIEGTAAFVCSKVSATLQCCRCKTSFNMKTVPKKNNSHVCTKCSKNVGFTFEPTTVHQFSSVLGNFHLLECLAVDINLVECHFLVDCLNCLKQVPVDGIHYGQKHKMWCLFCNQKMLISIGSVKFQTLNLTSAAAIKLPSAKKIEKKSKDPLIKEGEPLPDFGACKHYKKSFRWLRFPCCGRLYPCDECHNEKETDHEMKYASRMICGFCSKEQPYSRDKPCFLCSQSMTKKSGSHWEGGKGCRNRITMCREDKQKYSGINKTISKKAQTTKPKKKH